MRSKGMTDPVDSTSTSSAVPKTRMDGSLSAKSGAPSVATPPFPIPAALVQESLIRRFLGLIRFSHTIFALPFAALACVFAITSPGWQWQPLWLAVRMIGVLLCMVSARSAAMAFNRLVDAEFDRQNPRTASRHIPSGQLSSQQVWGFFWAMSFAFVLSCLLFLPNWLPVVLSIPVLAWLCGYSFAKRFTSVAHLWLGVALALSPVCAWIALRGESVIANPAELLPTFVLAVSIAFWVAGFDIIYACQDADFDRQKGLHSLPSRLGIPRALYISAALHALMLVALCLLPILAPQLSLGWLYRISLGLVALLIIRQHALVKPHDLRRVGEAFFHINAIISLGLCTMAAIDAILR